MKKLQRLGFVGRRGLGLVAVLAFVLALVAAPSFADAAPRSGGSFSGRIGFRNSGGGFSSPSSGSSYRYGSGGGTSFFFLPSWGWGWGGGYGFGGFSSLVVLAIVGFGVYQVVRATRRYRAATEGSGGWGDSDGDADVRLDRAWVYRMQVAFGRSARGIQDRLARFAEEGDTSTGAGLASLLQQTALELMREKDAIRYAGSDGSGPMSLTNAESKMNGLALAERSRFQVERVRGADGKVRKSEVPAEEGREALELVVVTIIVATRAPLGSWKAISERQDLDAVVPQLGTVAPDKILGLEVVWTPADPNDSMTETDVMTTYPELRSV